MERSRFEIETERLRLRRWRASDGAAFARMNADAEVMADLGGPLTRADSDRKLARFQRSFRDHRITRWVVTGHGNRFLGYCGIAAKDAGHPLGAHHDIGWRLVRAAWGHGYATEAASAALADAFDRLRCPEVFAYTAADNLRSQSVMVKLGLERRPSRDFTEHDDRIGPWSGLVWSATHPNRESL